MSRFHAFLPAMIVGALSAGPVHASLPTVSVHDARVVEGAAGAAHLEFEVVASGPPRRLALAYSLRDLTTSAADGDYSPESGVIELAPDPARLIGHWGAGSLLIPRGIALAPNGDVIAVDGPSGRIHRFSSDGRLLSSFGVEGRGWGQMLSPKGVALNAAGDILVANFDGRVNQYDASGRCIRSWGSATSFDRLCDLAVDAAGFVYASDVGNNRIHRFSSSGQLLETRSTFTPGEPEYDGPLGIVLDAQGYMYVAKARSGRILKYAPDWTLVATWTDTKGFCSGADLHLDAAGNLLIADEHSARIVVLDAQGVFLTEWTIDEGPEHNPGEFGATAVVSDPEGNVYVGSRNSSSIAHFRWDRAAGTIVVPVADDATPEADERLELRLAESPDATLIDATAIGTISNDDPELGPDQVTNGRFEGTLAGWQAQSGATLELSADGIGGSQAARVTAVGSLSPALNDSPSLVASTASDARYRYSVWVRSPSAGTARLRVREYQAGVLQAKTGSEPVAFDGTWQRLDVAVRARTAGASLDFQVVGEFAASGQAFLVDDVTVQPLGADVPPVVEAVALADGSWARDVIVEVSAHDPEGDPIDVLEANLAALPGATFTVASDRTRGTLRWRPSFGDIRDSPHVVTFTARNAATTSTSTRIRVNPNLVLNPSFEQDLDGWSGHVGASLARVPGGRRDNFAARATLPLVEWAGLNDTPAWASPAGYGRRFVIGAWVRSESGPVNVRMQVREYQGGVQVASSSVVGSPLPGQPDATWRRVILAHTCVATGPSELDLTIDAQGTLGEVLDVDDVSMVNVGTPSTVGVSDASPVGLMARVVPNPARGRAVLELSVPATGRLRVELYDVAGRRRAVIADETRAEAGVLRFALSEAGARLAAGIYWYRASTAAGAQQGRFVVLE